MTELRNIKVILFLMVLLIVSCNTKKEPHIKARGMYYSKKVYDGKPIPKFEESKHLLPEPIMQSQAEWVDMYYRCWEIAFDHFKKPEEGSGYVSNILDEAFAPNIFQWDMIFMVMFARYGHDVFPGVNSLDNFYINQYPSGYICRELRESDGSDFIYEGRKNTINPPLFSWAEIETYQNTGDNSRFAAVLPVLEKYVEWLNRKGDLYTSDDPTTWENYGRMSSKSVHSLYWNTPLGSGMDNTPRSGDGWVDMSAQMVIQYNDLAFMSKALNLAEKEAFFKAEAKKIADRMNKYCWNEEDGLYYDVDSAGNHVKWKTPGCFWPMLANIACKEQAERLVEHLKDTNSFWRVNVFPTLAADQEGYDGDGGGYWLGSIWAPTNYAIIKGLENYGYNEFANQASLKYLENLYCVYKRTNTFWENYDPESCSQGEQSKPDFVGWTGTGPIAVLIENVLGFRLNANNKELTWHIFRTDKHGIKKLKMGDALIDAICEQRNSITEKPEITIKTDKDIRLNVIINQQEKSFNIKQGEQKISFE